MQSNSNDNEEANQSIKHPIYTTRIYPSIVLDSVGFTPTCLVGAVFGVEGLELLDDVLCGGQPVVAAVVLRKAIA